LATKVKKIPMRQCLGCNEHRPKQELLRVVRPPEEGGVVSLDMTGRKSGRGAYICRDVKCLRRARKSRRIETTLECSIPDQVWDEMEKELELYAAEQA
jgi:predicted RNA-binding protein YlxR (DUF448 family)